MPADALMAVQASVTKTATFNSTGVDLKTSSPPWVGLVVRLRYSAANTSAGAGAATFRITSGTDNSTFGRIVHAAPALVLSTTAIAGTLFFPVVTPDRYVRLELSAISGTDATVTYVADMVAAQPNI